MTKGHDCKYYKELNEWGIDDLPNKLRFHRVIYAYCFEKGKLWCVYHNQKYHTCIDVISIDRITVLKKLQHNGWRHLTSVCPFNNMIAFLGGQDANELPSSKCELYDVDRDEWKIIANMKKGRFQSSAWSVQGRYIYNFGGLAFNP